MEDAPPLVVACSTLMGLQMRTVWLVQVAVPDDAGLINTGRSVQSSSPPNSPFEAFVPLDVCYQ